MSRLLSLSLLAVLLVVAGCRTAEEVARTTGDAVGDAATAVADVASDAYSAAREELGGSRVADNARVAVAQISAPGDTTTGVTGTVTFVELTDGVQVRYTLRGLSPGAHGFHVHENGSCAAADSDGDGAREAGGAAGGHLNPMASEHGAPGDARTERHAGDLGNVTAGANGMAEGTMEDRVLAFSGPTSLVGKALMIHGQPDNLESDPGGSAGGRVGCGVIRMAARRM